MAIISQGALGYRTDIAGLRALAVLFVVLYHGFPHHAKGGFIGVDIFFVISGFLISRIIFTGLESGTFRFKEFFAKRIVRIFPSLILVISISLVLGWFVLLPDEYKQLGRHAFASATFVANFVFWTESGYFDTSSETKPLLHLWSLAVEEQFYILYPFLLWFVWKRKSNRVISIAVLATISLLLYLWLSRFSPIAAFYFPVTRFWQFLAGGILAWCTYFLHPSMNILDSAIGVTKERSFQEDQKSKKTTLPYISHILSFFGFTILILSFLFINVDFAFPGAWALAPTIGSLLLIAAGPKAIFNRKILCNPLAQ